MLETTYDTFVPDKKIFWLDCGNGVPKLKKLTIVGIFLHGDRVMVEATTIENIGRLIIVGGYPNLSAISESPIWRHGEYPSCSRLCFSVINPFFLTQDEVVILAKIGKSGEGVDGLLKFFSPYEAGTYSVEQNFKITNWVYYWKTHNTII